MNREKQQQIEQILNRAVKIAPDRRRAFLDESCDGDEDLRREVEALLESIGDGQAVTYSTGEIDKIIADAQEVLMPGAQIAHYEIRQKIGSGGMGEVFLAHDRELERSVALKILPPAVAQYKERVHRFVKEARAASALNHPNILTIYEIGQAGDMRFIASEYIRGVTLRERLRREPPNLKETL
ncbi:MAG TPA: protein kinase, partial [Pyrinomonadaceae bacterium]|nr:protein kinase [Pyrinomonadaceae bacterium]